MLLMSETWWTPCNRVVLSNQFCKSNSNFVFFHKISDCIFVKTASVPHDSGSGLFLMEKGQVFCTNTDAILSLVCTKIDHYYIENIYTLKAKVKG